MRPSSCSAAWRWASRAVGPIGKWRPWRWGRGWGCGGAWSPYEHAAAVEPLVVGFDLRWEEVGGRLWRDVSWNLRSTAVLAFAVAPVQDKHASSMEPGATSQKNPLQQILFSKRFIQPPAAHYAPTPPQPRGIKMYGSTFISMGGNEQLWVLHDSKVISTSLCHVGSRWAQEGRGLIILFGFTIATAQTRKDPRCLWLLC